MSFKDMNTWYGIGRVSFKPSVKDIFDSYGNKSRFAYIKILINSYTPNPEGEYLVRVKDPIIIDVTFFNKQAEFVETHVGAGDLVSIVGKLKNYEVIKKDFYYPAITVAGENIEILRKSQKNKQIYEKE